ncbi:MAG: hypothetical protein DMF68_09625 [Acidobacteria bacterium]|nr:MAG: hypothetical protein DMF68_09625 [Acidobacteriota bacterium]
MIVLGGCGEMGSEATRDLAQTSEFDEIVIADIDLSKAIGAKVNYLDLGGLYNTPKQLELDEEARASGVTICLGCGATPGVTNLMARRAADQLDEVSEVHIAFASFRSIAPSPGLLDTVLDEFSPGSRRFYWRAGEFIEVPAFSGARRVHFAEPVGTIEVYMFLIRRRTRCPDS